MGKILELKYKSPHSQRIADRVIDKPAAAKAQAVAPKPVLEQREVTGQAGDTSKRAAMKPRKVAASNTESVPVTPISAVTSNANAPRKRGRPRVLSDEQRREKVRQRVAGWRAAKAGKAGS